MKSAEEYKRGAEKNTKKKKQRTFRKLPIERSCNAKRPKTKDVPIAVMITTWKRRDLCRVFRHHLYLFYHLFPFTFLYKVKDKYVVLSITLTKCVMPVISGYNLCGLRGRGEFESCAVIQIDDLMVSLLKPLGKFFKWTNWWNHRKYCNIYRNGM